MNNLSVIEQAEGQSVMQTPVSSKPIESQAPAVKRRRAAKNLFDNKENSVPPEKINISMDAMKYRHIALVRPLPYRAAAISVDLETNWEFTQFKVFAKDRDGSYYRRQQVSLTAVESLKILYQLNHFVRCADNYVLNNPNLQPVNLKEQVKDISEVADMNNSQWCLDVHRSDNRLIRVSFVVYDLNQRLISTYFQIKFFKKDPTEQFKLYRFVNFTLQELKALADRERQLCQFYNF